MAPGVQDLPGYHIGRQQAWLSMENLNHVDARGAAVGAYDGESMVESSVQDDGWRSGGSGDVDEFTTFTTVPSAADSKPLTKSDKLSYDKSAATSDSWDKSSAVDTLVSSATFLSSKHSSTCTTSSAAESNSSSSDDGRDSIKVVLARLGLPQDPMSESADPNAVEDMSTLSMGSSIHHTGECTPCKFQRSARGCKDGSLCKNCHYPHAELTRSGVRKAQMRSGLQKRQIPLGQPRPKAFHKLDAPMYIEAQQEPTAAGAAAASATTWTRSVDAEVLRF